MFNVFCRFLFILFCPGSLCGLEMCFLLPMNTATTQSFPYLCGSDVCLFSIRLPRGASPGSLPGKHTCGSEGPGGPRKAQLLPRLRGLVSVPCPLSWLTPITPRVRLLPGLRCSPTARTQPPSPLQASTRACCVGAIWKLEDNKDKIHSALAGHTPRPGPSPGFPTQGWPRPIF